MEFDVEELDAPLGAVVRGWKPDEALSDGDREVLREALRRYLVLIFRGQPTPSDADLIRFARGFGDLMVGSEFLGNDVHDPEILPISNIKDDEGVPIGSAGVMPLGWHSDYAYAPRIGKESFLEAVRLPSEPPRTYFCSIYEALETLPADTIASLRELRSHIWIDTTPPGEDADELIVETYEGVLAKRERDARLGIDRPPIPSAVHPMIMMHPESGREALYVQPLFGQRILDLSDDAGTELLGRLREHVTRSENVYAHDWQVGDLVMFDTVGTLHSRDGWTSREPRLMRQLSTLC